MLGSLGFAEIAFIVVLALLIFGPRRLPEAGKMVGRAMGEFRRASNELRRTFNAELSLEEEERSSAPRRPAELISKPAEKPSEPASPKEKAAEEKPPGKKNTEEDAAVEEGLKSAPAPQPQGAIARGEASGPPVELDLKTSEEEPSEGPPKA